MFLQCTASGQWDFMYAGLSTVILGEVACFFSITGETGSGALFIKLNISKWIGNNLVEKALTV